MTLDIRIGTTEQKSLIEAEFSPVVRAIEGGFAHLGIDRILIANDFDAAVNDLQGITSYTSVRDTGDTGVVAVAKVLRKGASTTIVLSPYLYTETNDNQTRAFIILHELAHAINNMTFKVLPEPTTAEEIYLQILYMLYDEYLADHHAYQIVDALYPDKSPRWQDLMELQTSQYLQGANDPKHRRHIAGVRASWREHRDTDRFLAEIRPTIHLVTITITHLFANLHFRRLPVEAALGASPTYINEATVDLMDQFRLAAEMASVDVDELEPLLSDFLASFGVSFRDTNQGVYCEIVENG